MNEAAENVMRLPTSLTMDTAAAVFGAGLKFPERENEFVIDFAQVEAVDSAAVSLMLVWLRATQAKNVKLSFINVPENLRSLANLYGVAESLSLHLDN